MVAVTIAAVVGIADLTAVIRFRKDEVQGLGIVIFDRARGHHRPGFRVASVCDIYLRIGGLDIEQVIVVKHMGCDKGIGTDRIGYLRIKYAQIVGSGHPVCVEHRISGHHHLRACRIIPAVCHVIPAPQLVSVFAGG